MENIRNNIDIDDVDIDDVDVDVDVDAAVKKINTLKDDCHYNTTDADNTDIYNAIKQNLLTSKFKNNSFVLLKKDSIYHFIQLKHVTHFSSEGNYSSVNFASGSTLIKRSLNIIMSKLDNDEFIRVSRKHIINIHHITKVEEWTNGKIIITVGNKHKITIPKVNFSHIKEFYSL